MKGPNNYMCKKGFHPSSKANQKKIQDAKEREEAKRKHDEETLKKYLEEQELLEQKSLVSKESKDKQSLGFMYVPPPGIKKPDDKQSDKVEWRGAGKQATSSSSSNLINNPTSSKGICLEWKRDKPVGRPRPNVEVKKEVKKEPPSPASEIKKESIKQEPKIELCRSIEERKSGHSGYDDLKLNTKRIKKEL